MEADGLHLTIDYAGSSGIILTPEQKASLQTSLVILQHENKFHKVYFWGKIVGIKDDYFIAQGVNKDEFQGRRTFYSKDCVHWGLLTVPSASARETSRLAKGRFTGDPSNEFEHIDQKRIEIDGELTEEEETILIKEEDRLATVIDDIDSQVKIVPRGAFVRLPTNQVVINRTFEGLTVAEAAKLCNYMHFREPIVLKEMTLLQRANLDKATDFLDSIETDIPKGSWSLQFERGSGMVTLRSLLWAGYVFYHIPGSRRYGSVYFGTGEKNLDLPFML